MVDLIQDPQQTQGDSVLSLDTLEGALGVLTQGVSESGTLLSRGEWAVGVRHLLESVTGLVADVFPRLVAAIFVAAVFYVGYRVILGLGRQILRRSSSVDLGLEQMVLKSFKVFATGFIGLLVMSQMGFNVSALIAGLGIAGIAVGFAARDSLENFIAGMAILLDDPFVVGDWVLVDGTYGQVSEITLRSTRLRSQAGEIVIFPNILMTNQKVINQTKQGPVRVDVPFSIAYKESIDDAREAALSVLSGEGRVSDHYAPSVLTIELGESSIDLELRVWVDDPADSVPLRFSLTEEVRKALARADIEIPFPHLQLFIDGAKGLVDANLSHNQAGRGAFPVSPA